MSGESFRDITELDAEVDQTSDDRKLVARVTVHAHTAKDLQHRAMVEVSALFDARLDEGIWYPKETHGYKLAIMDDTVEAIRPFDHRAGWEATFLIGLVEVQG